MPSGRRRPPRYRDRHHVSGAKSDAGDAKLLADLVSIIEHNHRRVAGDSADVAAVKVLARAHQTLTPPLNQHTNALRSALREYYPGALEVFDDLHDRDALAILGRAPTPIQAVGLRVSKIRSALKAAGRQRNLDARALAIQAALRTEQLAAPAAVTAAFAASTRAMVGIIAELQPPDHRPLRPSWRHILRHTRTPTSTAPCQAYLVSSSAPGCSLSSGTTRTATPMVSVAKTTPEPHR